MFYSHWLELNLSVLCIVTMKDRQLQIFALEEEQPILDKIWSGEVTICEKFLEGIFIHNVRKHKHHH